MLLIQTLNGLQFGALLFLLAAGLTLVFGVMNFVNLAHGSLYMMGAYFGAAVANATGSFALALVVAIPAALLLGILVERIALAGLHRRDHLDQVLATFGLVLCFNELVRMIWGPSPVYAQVPEALSGTVPLFGIEYPAYRFAIIVIGLLVAAGLWWLIHRTRLGMLIRAGATHAAIVSALGVNIRLLNTLIFGLGAALAGLAGLMAGPLLAVQSGVGERILILALVAAVVGGFVWIRGAFLAALLIGVVDTLGRSFLPLWLGELVDAQVAQTVAPALGSMLIYLLMAAVLALRPQGLFPAAGR
ncbi:MAG TPA: branched-chain amino acid ABC transporter permease [Burkholderiaceae bacterium]|nr:branched-chain amino acid ABC transporter permease [Burkholderiaceae bacterium]